MNKPETLLDLKPSPSNPRSITPEALSGLQASLREFGDISGLVWNARSQRLVCGHQRLEGLKRSQKITFDHGRCVVVGETGEWPVRVVDWDEATEKAANIAANNPHIAGDWAGNLDALLGELQAELPDLSVELRLGELAGEQSADKEAEERVELPPPKSAWWLIRVPLSVVEQATPAMEMLENIEGVQVDATVR